MRIENRMRKYIKRKKKDMGREKRDIDEMKRKYKKKKEGIDERGGKEVDLNSDGNMSQAGKVESDKN